jgi:aspartate racemase
MLTDSDFLHRCEEWNLTAMSLPTAYWHVLTLSLDRENLRIPESVRLLIIGGEKALPDRLMKWQQLVGPRMRLLNTYGPTEATVVATLYDLTHLHISTKQVHEIPIGRPLPGVLTYILDTHLQPVPIGVPGELHIGGSNLAREYLNRPDITAEKFILDPFTKDGDARLYKTGDMARYLPDGNIEFLGRTDHQVKIRGFRIELGEIEALTRKYPDVREAVIIARDFGAGDQRLVAYVVADKRATFQVMDLRSYLMAKLPNYMIPSFFVLLDSFPMTSNSKVDRNALPAPEHHMHVPGKNFVAPRNKLELQLKKIWDKVLRVSPVGVTDNFFDLGGHSLLAVRLVAEMKKATGKNLTVIALFHAPTVEQMAKVILNEGPTEPYSSLIPMQPRGSKTPLFWLHDTSLINKLEPGQPQFLLKHLYQDLLLPPYSSIEKIAAHYIQDILDLRPEGPYILGGFCFWAIVALETALQLIMKGHEVPLLFLLDPPLPVTSPSVPRQREDRSFSSRVIYHTRNLANLGRTEKIAYIARKLTSAFKWLYDRTAIATKIKNVICKTYLLIGRPVPEALAKYYFNEFNVREILDTYSFRVYPGRVIVFNSDTVYHNVKTNWRSIVEGEVKVHVVSGAKHLELTKEPNASIWREWLTMYLNRLQANVKGKEV